MDIRCFIAIEITEEIKNDLGQLIDILMKFDADVKWVVPENLHITLKFLGNTPPALVPRIRESLERLLTSYKPFYIRICGTGVFPSKKKPRVIWVGVMNLDSLNKLKKDMEESMALLGYQKEDREFNPHLTLGRVRSPRGILNILGELDRFKEKDFGTIYVESIKLMRSELRHGGAQYSCLYDISFNTTIS
ncbi:MAG: RNA 2',3'-cyclic phosphodiesterase [Nitrospirota bacterium]